MRALGIALAALLLLMTPARAAVDPPVLDVAAVPNIDARGRTGYARFLLVNLPRAFALSQNGRWAWFGGGREVSALHAPHEPRSDIKECLVYGRNRRLY